MEGSLSCRSFAQHHAAAGDRDQPLSNNASNGDAWLDAVTMADADSMNRPNRPAQPSLVTKAYLDEKLGELETKLLTALARELDARFGQFTREMDARFAERDARFERFAKDMELRLARFENRVVWQILGTMAGMIVAMTAIFSAIVLIVGAD